MHIIAGKAVAFKEALSPKFKEYIQQVLSNAQCFSEEFTRRGYDLISGGTDTHLVLLDLQNKSVSGKQAENALDVWNSQGSREYGASEKGSPVKVTDDYSFSGDAVRVYIQD